MTELRFLREKSGLLQTNGGLIRTETLRRELQKVMEAFGDLAEPENCRCHSVSDHLTPAGRRKRPIRASAHQGWYSGRDGGIHRPPLPRLGLMFLPVTLEHTCVPMGSADVSECWCGSVQPRCFRAGVDGVPQSLACLCSVPPY